MGRDNDHATGGDGATAY
ncbi:hypothetical protein [uncultured Pelagimonas sp.]